MYQKDGDERVIVMDTNNRYRKTLEKECPQEPTLWYHYDQGSAMMEQTSERRTKKVQHGLKRWKALPESIDVSLTIEYQQKCFMHKLILHKHLYCREFGTIISF